MRTVLIAAMLLVAACKQNKSKLDDMIAHPPTISFGSGAAPYGSAPNPNVPGATMPPDRQTERPNVLPYDDPFSPSTAPFKSTT